MYIEAEDRVVLIAFHDARTVRRCDRALLKADRAFAPVLND